MAKIDLAIVGIALIRDNINTASELWGALIDPHNLDRFDSNPEPGGLPLVRSLLNALADRTDASRFGSLNLVASEQTLSSLPDTELAAALPNCDWTKVIADGPEIATAIQKHATAPDSCSVVMCKEDDFCAAIVLAAEGQLKQGDRIYARIRGHMQCSEQLAEASSVYAELGRDPSDVSYLMIPGLSELKTETAAAISRLYSADSPAYTLPIGVPGDPEPRHQQIFPALIQAALALSNRLLPGNPAGLRFDYQLSAPLYLARNHRPWFHPADRSRLAAIHDPLTGLHLVLEEVTENSSRSRPPALPFAWEAETAIFSAPDRSSMIEQLTRFNQVLALDDHTDPAPVDIAAACHQAADPQLSFRLAIVFRNIRNLKQLLRQALAQLEQNTEPKSNTPVYYADIDPAQPPKLACIFPGLGFPGLVGRYTDNLYQLSLRIPEIRQTFDLVEQRDNLGQDPYPTSHLFFPTEGYDSSQATTLRNRLASPKHSEALNFGVPDRKNLSSFCVALSNWASWIMVQALELPVSMTFGQSLGELSALCAAGKFDFKQFAPTYWRTEVAPEYFSDGGCLVAASASAERIEPIVADYPTVVVAVYISPDFQLLGGKRDEVEQCVEKLRQENIWTQTLPYPAIHTPYFSELRTSMEPEIRQLEIFHSSIDVYSGMTADVYPHDPDQVRSIMLDNLDHPVHFWRVTRKLYEDGARVLLQTGGGATMYSHVRTNIGAEDVTAISIDVDYRGPVEQLNHMCAALYTAGITPNLEWLYRYRPTRPERWHNLVKAFSTSGRDTADDLSPTTRETPEQESQSSNRLPFAGRIQQFKRGHSLQVDYTLDLGNDLHLADHAFVNAQGVKPLSECLPVLPMTMSLELMAQVAAQLTRGYGLVGFKAINATAWIALRDANTLNLRIDAHIENRDSDTDSIVVRVAITSEGRTRPEITGLVVMSRTYHETLRLALPQLENLRPYPFRPDEIYSNKTLFHGPLFQCISGQTWLADNGVLGELVVNSRAGMFADNPDPLLLSDPLLLDAVGQLIGLWAMEHGKYVYPINMGHIEIYAPTPPTGTRVPVTINISKEGLKTLYADIEIQDGNGHLWMRISRWGDWAFKWPQACVNYTRDPARQLFATPLHIEVSEQSCTYIAENPRMDAVMLESMSRTTLTRRELEHFKALEDYPHRQKQWLMGRVAAKDAVRAWLAVGGDYLHPASLSIEQEEGGRPVVTVPEGCQQPYISLSHTDKYTVAIAGGHPVGIDIEAIAERDNSFVEAVSTADERALIEQINQDRSQGVTLLWSAKESAGKLTGTGLPDNPRQIQLEGLDTNGLLHLHHIPLDVQIRVNSWLSDDHFITVALNE